VPTYDKKPQMSAPDLTFEVLRRLEKYDLVIMNYANPDMVGHTGVVEAGVHACETIDLGVRMIVEKVLELGGKLFITADHGNCEQMRNADGSPHTAHTTNLVHGIYVAADADSVTVANGKLADIAPTLLDMLGVAKSAEMTGKSPACAKIGVSQGKIVRDQLMKAKTDAGGKPFMKLAGVIKGPKNLSQRKGFSKA
jgi:2,3-bisphosphoglycerate-independent phosphoglycerate mutase